MKPDIVFFGQNLPEEFHRQMQLDKDECDLLIVIGSSLKVQPVALIPSNVLVFVFFFKFSMTTHIGVFLNPRNLRDMSKFFL